MRRLLLLALGAVAGIVVATALPACWGSCPESPFPDDGTYVSDTSECHSSCASPDIQVVISGGHSRVVESYTEAGHKMQVEYVAEWALTR